MTNTGGPAILATDMLVGAGGELAALSPETARELDLILPWHWSAGGEQRGGHEVPAMLAGPCRNARCRAPTTAAL